MSELPTGWEVASLEEIAMINPRHPSDLKTTLPVTFVRMPALSETSPAFDSTETRPLGEVRKGYTHFAEGDVLFAKITPCMENGKAAVATGLTNGLGCGTTELHVLRPLGGIDSKYVFYFVHQDAFRREAAHNFIGTAGQLRVPVSFIREAEIPLAPLAEQRRIVAKLEVVLGKVAGCQHRLAKLPVLLKRFRQSVLAAACSGKLTADWRETRDEPEWREAKIGDFCLESFYGPRFGKDEYTSDGVPTIRTTDFTEDGRIRFNDPPRVKVPKAKREKFLLKRDDLLVTRTGSIGKMAIFREDGDAIPSAYLIRFRFSNAILVDFVFLWLMSPEGQNLLGLSSTAVTQPNINAESIKSLRIPLPPLAEQEEIVRRVGGLLGLADRIEDGYEKAQSRVRGITPSLLAKAFRGALVPQDPNDEPASELLTRIRTTRTN